MADLRSPRLMHLKAALFVAIGVLASALLLQQSPTLRTAALLALAVWAFCRAYYFAFYVIQHYIDDRYRFAGLWSFVRYLVRRRGPRRPIQAALRRQPANATQTSSAASAPGSGTTPDSTGGENELP
jgi:hypothetical protein